jgi:hypothetical protein
MAANKKAAMPPLIKTQSSYLQPNTIWLTSDGVEAEMPPHLKLECKHEYSGPRLCTTRRQCRRAHGEHIKEDMQLISWFTGKRSEAAMLQRAPGIVSKQDATRLPTAFAIDKLYLCTRTRHRKRRLTARVF